MNYCSLDDAFPTTEGVPSPGCMNDQASRQARKEERRKMRRCKTDPDRQQYGKLPEVPAMNVSTGLTEQGPFPQGPLEQMEPFEPLIPLPTPNKPANTYDSSEPMVSKKKKFFGADPDDSFADYMPDQKDYQLQPDFLASFEQTGLGKASALPAPSSDMYWKPTTSGGAQTAFVESLAPPKYHRPREGKGPLLGRGDVSMEDVMKRMDLLFARLDDLNATTPEQMTSELLMFISSGIFVLFMMDLLVKKGSRLRF